MCVAWKPAAVSAFCASTGKRDPAYTSAANGAISRSAMSRTAARIASCSSERAYSRELLLTGTRINARLLLCGQALLQRGVPGHDRLGELGLVTTHGGTKSVVRD